MPESMRKVTLSWLPKNFDKDDFNRKYGYLMDPDEYISDKLKKIKFDFKDINENNEPKYIKSISEAKSDFNNSIMVYKLKKEVIDKIKDTKIEKMPNEIPDIFSKPFIVETIDSNDTLFGDVNSITGYFSSWSQQYEQQINDSSDNTIIATRNKKLENEKIFSLLIHSNNKDNEWQDSADQINNRKEISGSIKYLGYNIFEWQPYLNKTNWEFSKKNYDRNVLNNKNYCRECILYDKCNKDDRYNLKDYFCFCFDGLCDNTMSFLTILNYMLIAENSPIIVKKEKSKINKIIANKKKKIISKTEEWVIRYLYIDKTKKYYEKHMEHEKLEKEGYVLKEVKVKGHLRNQAYGEGFKLRRWIYIESFISSKWIKEGDVKIIVDYK